MWEVGTRKRREVKKRNESGQPGRHRKKGVTHRPSKFASTWLNDFSLKNIDHFVTYGWLEYHVSSDVLTLLLKSTKPTKETNKQTKERKKARINRVREKQFLRKENSVYKRLESGLVGQVGKINIGLQSLKPGLFFSINVFFGLSQTLQHRLATYCSLLWCDIHVCRLNIRSITA